jgi:hypothetical protein
MLVVQHYLYLPGCCAFCRSSNLPTIDTRMDLDGHNSPDDPNPSAVQRMYVCADCALNLATLVADSRGIKLVTEIWYQEMTANAENLARQNLEKQRELDELKAAISVIKIVNDEKKTEEAVEKVSQKKVKDEEPANFKVVTSPGKA